MEVSEQRGKQSIFIVGIAIEGCTAQVAVFVFAGNPDLGGVLGQCYWLLSKRKLRLEP